MVILRLHYAFCFLVTATVVACADGYETPRPRPTVTPPAMVPTDAAPVKRELRVWAEDHPLLRPFDVVLDGCRGWYIGDVDCVLTTENDADVRILAATPDEITPETTAERADAINCVPNDAGKFFLAVADGAGLIEFYPACFARGLDPNGLVIYDTISATTVVTHEVGHELGIPHVPRDCAEPVIMDGMGRALCGQAVMNPRLDLSAAPGLTEVDEAMFDAFVINLRLPPTAQGCVYMTAM